MVRWVLDDAWQLQAEQPEHGGVFLHQTSGLEDLIRNLEDSVDVEHDRLDGSLYKVDFSGEVVRCIFCGGMYGRWWMITSTWDLQVRSSSRVRALPQGEKR